MSVDEVEKEVTSLWALLHATASGCISIAMWEVVKEFQIGVLGTWTVFLSASFALIHAVHLHRRAVTKTINQACNNVVSGDNQVTE